MNSNKTAMMEFRLILELYPDNDARADLLKWIDKIGLPKEKTQIVDARTDGFASTFIMGDPKDRMLVLKGDNETYFNQTYKP